MNRMQTIENIEGVRCYIDNDTVQLNLEDVARGLGFTTVATSGNECIRWTRVKGHLVRFGLLESVDDDAPRYIAEPYFYKLAMKASNQVAETFQDKVAFEILPTLRKNGAYIINACPKPPEKTGDLARYLRVVSRYMEKQGSPAFEIMQMIAQVSAQHGINLPVNVVKPTTCQMTFYSRQ